MKEVLVLFSGGKDSLLLALLLLEKGYKVFLVTYENGCGLNSKAAVMMGKRLVRKYGKDKVEILGVKNISPIWREFLKLYYNLVPSDILGKYGEVPVSQFNCLTCRLSMYIASIIICKKLHIHYVADGARKVQLFMLEQEPLLERFVHLFQQYDINMLFLLKDLDDDFDLKNQILIRGIVPKTYEPQCLIGMPVTEISDNVYDGVINVYDKLLREEIEKIIIKYKDVDIAGEYL